MNGGFHLPHWVPTLPAAVLSATLLDRPAGVWSRRAAARFPLSCPQTLKKQEHGTMAHPWLWFGPFPLLPSPALSQRAYGYTPPALWGRPRLKYPAARICHLLASHMRSKLRLRDRNPDGAHCHTASTWQSWELQPNKGCHLLISSWHTAHCRPSAGSWRPRGTAEAWWAGLGKGPSFPGFQSGLPATGPCLSPR